MENVITLGKLIGLLYSIQYNASCLCLALVTQDSLMFIKGLETKL